MGAPDAKVIEQAAVWMTTFQSGEATAADEVACARWRAADPAHETAWEMISAINLRIRDGMAGVPPAVARHALGMSATQRSRRDMVKSLAGIGALAMLGGGTWLLSEPGRYDRLAADQSTGPGERRTIELPDGSVVTLNTASAIDIAFDRDTRTIRLLTGEIAVHTAKDARHRPLRVATRFGDIVPLGTRFVVRDVSAGTASARADTIFVAVTEGAVRIAPVAGSTPAQVSAGQQASFNATAVGTAETLDLASRSWLDGMLLARRMPLPDFIAELARYRRGVLRCDPSLATLSVSGAFPLDDTDAALMLLAKAVPVRTRAITPYWVTVLPR